MFILYLFISFIYIYIFFFVVQPYFITQHIELQIIFRAISEQESQLESEAHVFSPPSPTELAAMVADKHENNIRSNNSDTDNDNNNRDYNNDDNETQLRVEMHDGGDDSKSIGSEHQYVTNDKNIQLALKRLDESCKKAKQLFKTHQQIQKSARELIDAIFEDITYVVSNNPIALFTHGIMDEIASVDSGISHNCDVARNPLGIWVKQLINLWTECLAPGFNNTVKNIDKIIKIFKVTHLREILSNPDIPIKNLLGIQWDKPRARSIPEKFKWVFNMICVDHIDGETKIGAFAIWLFTVGSRKFRDNGEFDALYQQWKKEHPDIKLPQTNVLSCM